MRTLMKRCIVIAICLITLILSACKTEKVDVKKLKDVDFTVVEEADIPEELLKLINEKKTESFKMTFTSEDAFYIVVGYGAKPTGGFSIAINDVYLTKNAIYFDTDLIGPEEGESVTQATTYPFVVAKLPKMDMRVLFK